MKRFLLGSIFIVQLFNSVPAHAQELQKKSVYKIDPWTDGTIIGVTTLGVIADYYNSDLLIRPRCPCDLSELNSLDRQVVGNHDDNLDHLSDIAVVAGVTVPFYFDWKELGYSEEFKEDAVVFIETLTVNSSLVTLAKYNVQRPLPRTYAGDPALIQSARGYRSFYSGHTSTIFAALSAASFTYNQRHGTSNVPWIITGVVGAGVAYARVAAGKHFYTDVIVGAGMGTAVGIMVPWLHSRERLAQFSLIPMGDAVGVMWTKKF